MSVGRFADLYTSVLLGMHIGILKPCGSGSNCGRVVEVGVDLLKHAVVMLIRTGVVERISVVHASVEVGARFILMVQTEEMPNLLTDSVLPVYLNISIGWVSSLIVRRTVDPSDHQASPRLLCRSQHIKR
jgi:hypothetical protein